MTKGRRGWSSPEQAKPASEYDIRFGHGLLRADSAAWPRYAAVTTPSAFKAAQLHLIRKPAAAACVVWKDASYLDQLSDGLPSDAELVVGIGGGMALDAAKWAALRKDLPAVLVPTVVSSGAIIHGQFTMREGRNPVGGPDRRPWLDCEHVLVDYDLVLAAPAHLNTAGLGDVLCGYAGLAEWRRNSRRGIGPAWDEEAVAPALQHHHDIIEGFPRTLDAQGKLTDDSVRFIVTAIQERDAKAVRNPAAPGGDHAFVNAIELVNNKGWVHGEVVALGAVIIAWQCGEYLDELVNGLDVCRVRRRPTQMGISREELRKGLEFAPEFMADRPDSRGTNTILRNEPVIGARFDALWEFLEAGR